MPSNLHQRNPSPSKYRFIFFFFLSNFYSTTPANAHVWLFLQSRKFNFVDALPSHSCISDSSPHWQPGSQCSGQNRAFVQNTCNKCVGFSCGQINLLLCTCAADVKSRLNRQNSSRFWDLVAVVSGPVSAVSLVSTFVPPSNGHIILCTSWFCRCHYHCSLSIRHIVYGRLSSALRRYFEAIFHQNLELVRKSSSSSKDKRKILFIILLLKDLLICVLIVSAIPKFSQLDCLLLFHLAASF